MSPLDAVALFDARARRVLGSEGKLATKATVAAVIGVEPNYYYQVTTGKPVTWVVVMDWVARWRATGQPALGLLRDVAAAIEGPDARWAAEPEPALSPGLERDRARNVALGEAIARSYHPMGPPVTNAQGHTTDPDWPPPKQEGWTYRPDLDAVNVGSTKIAEGDAVAVEGTLADGTVGVRAAKPPMCPVCSTVTAWSEEIPGAALLCWGCARETLP